MAIKAPTSRKRAGVKAFATGGGATAARRCSAEITAGSAGGGNGATRTLDGGLRSTSPSSASQNLVQLANLFAGDGSNARAIDFRTAGGKPPSISLRFEGPSKAI